MVEYGAEVSERPPVAETNLQDAQASATTGKKNKIIKTAWNFLAFLLLSDILFTRQEIKSEIDY